MPLCSISLLCCVFPICGITHLLKKVKKRQVRIKTRPGWPKMKPPYLRYHFLPGNCLPFTWYPLLLLLYRISHHPIFLNFPLLPLLSLPPPPTSYPNISITYPTVTPLPSLWPDTSNSPFLPKYPSHWLLNWIRRALDYISDTLTSLTVFRSLQQALTFKS